MNLYKITKLGHYEPFDFGGEYSVSEETIIEDRLKYNGYSNPKEKIFDELRLKEIKTDQEKKEKLEREKRNREIENEINRIRNKLNIQVTEKTQSNIVSKPIIENIELNEQSNIVSKPIIENTIMPNYQGHTRSINNIRKKYTKEKEEFVIKNTPPQTKSLSYEVEDTVIEKINFTDGLNDTEIAVLSRKKSNNELGMINIEDYTKIEEILSKPLVKGTPKSDIALFQFFANKQGYNNVPINGILDNYTNEAFSAMNTIV